MAEPQGNNKNRIGAFLIGYGFTAFWCFMGILLYWQSHAPRATDSAHGFIYAHNSHGAITYFSAFQATSCTLLFCTSIPLAFLGVFIVRGWRLQQPRNWIMMGAAKFGFLSGVVAAPIIVFLLGPTFVHWLNAMGFVFRGF